MITMDLDRDLNKEQSRAVAHLEGALLVLAGAGSGKTRCVTYRIANLLEHGIPADSILGLTFTNKAAAEMKERIEKITHRRVLVCTFHSLGARILRASITHLGYSDDFSIYDEDDTIKVVKTCLKDLELDEEESIDAKTFRWKISEAKNQLKDPDSFDGSDANDLYEKYFPAVYQEYTEKLKEYNALDFDDLLFLTVRLFKEHPEVLEYYQKLWQFLLIDEYQDTNEPQYQIVKKLVSRHGNVFAVGDPDQSIYSWRGANISNILSFKEDFPGAEMVTLEQNYRSTSNILNAANALIAHNAKRYEKRLWSDLGEGEKIKLYVSDTDRDEARFVAERVRHHHREENIPFSEMAVLYRTNFQSRLFEDQLLNRRIPYIIIGGLSFYQRREIKDVISYLRLVASPSDFVSFLRTINMPKRGIGPTSIEKLRLNAVEEGMGILEYCRALLSGIPLKTAMRLAGKQRENLNEYVQLIDNLAAEEGNSASIETLIKMVIERIGYFGLLEKDPETASDRKANLEELIVKGREWDQQGTQQTLTDFLEEMSLKSTMDEMTPGEDRLKLMTMHNGKGLEFNTVFVVGLENDLLPHANSRNSNEQFEEERRLLYVGMTRAKRNLYLTYALSRHMWGQHRQTSASCFIKDIPREYIEMLQLGDSQGRNPMRRSFEVDAIDGDFIDDIDQTVEADDPDLLSPGQSVFHKSFGIGVVKRRYQGQYGLTYDVLFTNESVPKSLVAKYAKLSRI